MTGIARAAASDHLPVRLRALDGAFAAPAEAATAAAAEGVAGPGFFEPERDVYVAASPVKAAFHFRIASPLGKGGVR